MRPGLIAIFMFLSSSFAFAQASYDLRIVETSDDNTNSGTLSVTLQIRANSSSSPDSFALGTSTILIDYNTAAITYASLTASNFDGFLPPSTFYTAMTAVDNSGKLSVNIELSTGPETGQPTIKSAWVDVCVLSFTIVDASLREDFFIYDNTKLGSKTEVFDDDQATELSPEILIGFTNTDNNEIYWDGDAWYNGSGTSNAPGSTDGTKDVVILGMDAVISDQVAVNDLDLHNGTLTVRPTSGENHPSITVNGTLVTNDNAFTLESNENGYSQVLGAVTGDVTFQMYVSAAGWHNIASPIASMTLADLEDDILINYSGNSSGVSAYSWNASAGIWVAANANTDAFTGGWNVYIDNNFVPSGQGVNSDGNLPVILDLTGTINTGNQNVASLGYTGSPLWSTFTGTNSTGNSGWNLIANPYPSNLDWSEVNKDFGGASINAYYYIWDPSSGAYVYHNGSAGSATRSATISPMQAIWVKLDDAGETGTSVFNFTDADRTVSSPANFLKTTEALVLELSDGNNTLDQTQLIRELGYSADYDASGDAVKQHNPGKANFFFITDDSLAVALNSIGKSFMGDTVMLGLTDASHGSNYSIRVSQNSLPSDFTEKLVDLKTGNVHDLSTGAYTFTHDTAFGEHRFNLMAVSKTIGLSEESSENHRSFDVRAASNGDLIITFPSSMTGLCDMNVIDMAGRVIHAEENVSTRSEHHFSFNTNVSEAAVYIIRLRDTKTDEVWSAKVVY